jgi:3',5'-cyclic AMP phosphodiesterase CpdA
MSGFVLAHLSDPHLAPLPRPRLLELAGKRLTGYANWWRKRRAVHRSDVLARIRTDLAAQAPDHVAVTGDFVNIALPAEYGAALAFLQSLGSPDRVTAVPGNHDAYVAGGMAACERACGDYMRGDDGATGYPFWRRRGPLAVIGTCSALPTGLLMATGTLGAAQIARLGELLARCGAAGLFRVVLIHHPPLPTRSDRFKQLTDAAALRAALARHGAELVLHGHRHAHLTGWLDGPKGRIPAVGVPSASESLPGEHDAAGYNLYRIEGSAGAWRCRAISRGLQAGRDGVVETADRMLIG